MQLRIALICPTRAEFHLGSEALVGLGGIEAANVGLARALSTLGHDVLLFSRTDITRTADGVINAPLDRMHDQLAAHPVDVAISSNDTALFELVTPHAMKIAWWHNPFSLAKLMRRGQLLPLVRQRPHAVFGGKKAKSAMLPFLPFKSRHVIDLGLDPVFLQHPLDQERKPVAVFASQVQRGLRPTLAAWCAASERRPPTSEFHVFGTTAAQVDWSDAEASRHSVVFHGRVKKTDMVEIYARASVMVVPGAHDETFCLAAAEAQAMGLPVITMGIGALSERVRHGVDGLIVRDHREMMDAAFRLLRDRASLTAFSEAAIKVRARLTWQHAADRWSDIFRGIPARQDGDSL